MSTNTKTGSPGRGKSVMPQLKGQNIISKNVVLQDSLPRGGNKNPMAKQGPGRGPRRVISSGASNVMDPQDRD